MTEPEPAPLYEFDGFRLDPGRHLLFRSDGSSVPLKPKVFDTLLHLIEQRGQLVKKAALMKAVWGDLVVEENSLNQHVSMLRHALGEVPGENRFIVTIPGRGYRFVAPVRTLAPASEDLSIANDLEPSQQPPAPFAGAHTTSSARARYVAAFVAALALAASFVWYVRPREQIPLAAPRAADVVRFQLDLAPGERLSGGLRMEQAFLQRPSRPSFALSPDGRDLVYAAVDGETTKLYRRPMDQLRSTSISGTEGASQPFFSPDGDSVGFLVGNALKRVPVGGGEVRTLAMTGAELSILNLLPSWTESDTILVSADNAIYELPAIGGGLGRLTQPAEIVPGTLGYTGHAYPQMLPGRRAVLFNEMNGIVPSRWNIVVATLDGAEHKVVIEGGSHPRYLPSGHIVFARGGTLLAIEFDLARLEKTGDPVVVVEHVMHGERGINGDLNAGAAQFSVSDTGTLAYVEGGAYPPALYSLVFVDRQGVAKPVPNLRPAEYIWPRFSPDGGRLSYGVGYFGDMQLWVYDRTSESGMRLTSIGHNAEPTWSPDGTRLAFNRSGPGAGLFAIAANGSDSEPRRIAGGVNPQPSSWSIDNVLAFVDGDDGRDLWTVRVDGESRPEPFLQTSSISWWPDFSPDGRWIAYVSAETGRPEIYVRPFSQAGPVERISPEGGTSPVWSRDGKELFYIKFARTKDGTPATQVMVVDVTWSPTFRTSRPRLLFEGPYEMGDPIRTYDVSLDGRQFVFAQPEPAPAPEPATRINIVLNWLEEL